MLRKRRHPAPAAAATFNTQPMAPSHLRSYGRESACCYDACCVEQRRLSTRHRILRFMASGVRSLVGTLSTLNSCLHPLQGFAYSLLAYQATMAGLAKVTVNEQGSQPHTNAFRQCKPRSLARTQTCMHACT
jgi:hypothetical protein